jgi:hypothetical protein
MHGFFHIQSGSSVASPPATHQKSNAKVREAPSNVELDSLAFGARYSGPVASGKDTPKAQVPSPTTPNELEMSRPPSPTRNETVGLVQTWNNPPMNKWRVLSCCLLYFANGMNDSGTLVVYIPVHALPKS